MKGLKPLIFIYPSLLNPVPSIKKWFFSDLIYSQLIQRFNPAPTLKRSRPHLPR
jgi:hypothetical protein